MSFYLLCLSIIIIPIFGQLTILPLTPELSMEHTKEFLSLIFILSIFFSTKKTEWSQLPRNPYLNFLVLFLILSIYNSPTIKMFFGYEDVYGMWAWKSFSWVLAYYIFYIAIQQINLTWLRKRALIECIAWTAMLCAVCGAFQFFDIDQFQVTRSLDEIGNPVAKRITSTIGNPTYLGVFLTICLPFCFIYKRWWWTLIIFCVILMCQSDIATMGASLTIFFIMVMRQKSMIWIKLSLMAVIFLTALTLCYWHEIRPRINDNSRFSIWRQTIKDWQSPPIFIEKSDKMTERQIKDIELINKRTYAVTGRGMGSFPIYFDPVLKFEDPHNVYLRVLYEIGIIGLFLFLSSIILVLKNTFNLARNDRWTLAIYTSFFFICLAMIGLPILKVEPLRYFSAIMFSLLSRQKIA